MIPQPPIPEALWSTVPPEAQVAILAVLDFLRGRITELEQRVARSSGVLDELTDVKRQFDGLAALVSEYRDYASR